MTHNNDTLNGFYLDNADGTLALIVGIEHYLATNQLMTANTLINQFSTSSNIKYNFKRFFILCYRYLLNGYLTNSEKYNLSILAAQCPFTDGPAIYKARTLLDLIDDNVTFYNDDLCKSSGYSARMQNCSNVAINPTTFLNNLQQDESQQKKVMPKKSLLNSKPSDKYKIYPNPTSNEFSITCKSASEIIDITIIDIFGKELLKGRFTAENFTVKLNGNLMNGIYFISILDLNHENSTQKIIITH